MDDEEREELKALIVSFLQQSLKERPEGFSIQELERLLPERCDESRDWYKRYNKKSALECLECIKDTVTLNRRNGTVHVSLNIKSDKVDSHLVDLITNQRSSNKKRNFKRPSSRALVSFSLNRQYSNHQRRPNYTTRLNHGQQYRGENFVRSPPHTTDQFRPSIYNKSNSSWMPPNDPRNRGSNSMVPPQVRPPVTLSSPSAPPKPTTQVPRFKPQKSTAEVAEQKKSVDDPELEQKKVYLRQKIVFLLTKKFREIKILHLASLYKLEFEETIEPSAYGHSSLTSLLQDPVLSSYIQINYVSPFITISAKSRTQASGKENIVSGDKQSVTNGLSGNTKAANTNASAKAKLDAIDPFNVRSMIKSLEPLGDLREPPLQEIQVDEGVKYKTMRIIFKSPDLTLRLDDWPAKFLQETRLQIRLREYGFKTLLEFFKHLAKELPIKIKLNNQDDWTAVGDLSLLSDWMQTQMSMGHYRAVTAVQAHYELIAFPNDSYTYNTSKDLIAQEYLPAFILSVKRSDSIWIQLRTPRSIEDHLCIEASMTCYEDYKKKEMLTVPNAFIKPGFPCAIFDNSQQRWCRALILKAPENMDRNREITALLVDYATIKTYVATQLLCLMKTHLKLTVGPIYSKLSGVNETAGLVMQHSVKQVLQEYTSPPVTLACKFINAAPSNEPDYLPKFCYEVTLVDTRSGRDCNLADDINLPRYSLED